MKPFNKSNYDWSVGGLFNCIDENNLNSEVLFYNEYGAIVYVKSYNESVILGAESTWCISQHRESWTQYVEKTNGIQLFFYCFDKSTNGDESLYGATFQVEKNKAKVYCCFTRENNPIAKAHKTKDDETAIKAVVEDYYGDIFDEVKDVIIKIHKKDKREKPVDKKKEEKKGQFDSWETVSISNDRAWYNDEHLRWYPIWNIL